MFNETPLIRPANARWTFQLVILSNCLTLEQIRQRYPGIILIRFNGVAADSEARPVAWQQVNRCLGLRTFVVHRLRPSSGVPNEIFGVQLRVSDGKWWVPVIGRLNFHNPNSSGVCKFP